MNNETQYNFSWVRPEVKKALKKDMVYINWGWILVLSTVFIGTFLAIKFIVTHIVHILSVVVEVVFAGVL